MLKLVSTTLLVAALAAACKQQASPPPQATAAPTAYVAPIAPQSQIQQTQPTVAPPLCDASVKECAPDPKVVELCRQQESDQTKCENGIEKALYDALMAKMEEAAKNAADTTETCKSTRYVNTQADPLNVRDKASTAGIIIGDVARGGSLCVIDQVTASNGLWYKLNFNGKVGFVFGELTSSTKPATSTTPQTNTGGTTPTQPSAECSLQCPSGYKCSLTQSWGGVHTPDYFLEAREDSERKGSVPAGQSICTTGNIQNATAWGVTYTMVRMKARAETGFTPDYWMNCKYLSTESKTRIGCK